MENTPEPTSPDGFIGSIEDAFAGLDSLGNDAPEPKLLAETPTDKADAPAEGGDDVDTQDGADTQDDADKSPLEELEGADEPNKDWTPQAARRFKQLKAELKTSKSRLTELESSLNERESRLEELEALADNPEYENLKTRVSDYEKQMLITNLESSQIYKELVSEPLSELVSDADTIAEKYSVDPNELLDAIALEDETAQEEALADLLAAASDRDRFRIYKIIEQIKPILHQRSVLQENAQEALKEAEQLQEVSTKQQLIERAAEREKAATAVADKIRTKLTFLEGIEGIDFAEMTKKVASVDPSAISPVDAAFQTFSAQIFPKMAREYLTLRKELDVLTDKLAKYDRATPRAGGGMGNGNSPLGQSAADGKSFMDAVSAAFGG